MSEKPSYRIFMSCGTPYRQEQEAFISAVEKCLRNNNCETHTIGRNSFSIDQPVKFARDTIAECDGIVVIAFERIRLDKGKDKPGSKEEKPVNGRSFPTVWNHMEAAMAYANDLPVLTFVASGLHREGMLSKRFEWLAQEVELTPEYLATDQFNQTFKDWLHRIDKRKNMQHEMKIDASKLQIRDLILALTPQQFWGFIVATVTAFAAIFAVGFELGSYLKKP
jgi:hypothetical protein